LSVCILFVSDRAPFARPQYLSLGFHRLANLEPDNPSSYKKRIEHFAKTPIFPLTGCYYLVRYLIKSFYGRVNYAVNCLE